MNVFFDAISQKLDPCLQLMNRLCTPNPKHVPEKIQQEIVRNRNRVVVAFHLIASLIILQKMILQEIALMKGLFIIVSALLIISFIVLSCYYHPLMFTILYNILMAVYGPALTHFTEAGIVRAWIGVQSYTLFTWFCTGNIWQFLLQSVLQLAYLNSIYQEEMLRAVTFMSPEGFTGSLTQASNSLMLFCILIVICVQMSLQSAYDRVLTAEKKKDEVEMQKTFLLGFSHELRNLINSLMGNVRLASLEVLSERVSGFLQNADLCGELLLHLVNNILDTGKIEVGDLEVNPMPNDVYNTVEKIWSVCLELIRRKNLNGTLRISRNTPHMLKFDHYRLAQVFLNVIGNAVKFTEKGSVDIKVEWINGLSINKEYFESADFGCDDNDDEENDMSEGVSLKNRRFSFTNNKYITLTTSQTKISQIPIQPKNQPPSGILKVTVNDTGCGISNGNIEKVFQKFSQISFDATNRKLGTGLGLFITKELCRRMNGEVKAFSKLNRGSSFIFCLPMETVPQGDRQIFSGCSLKDFETFRQLKAMVVDDDLFSQTILNNYFHKYEIGSLKYCTKRA